MKKTGKNKYKVAFIFASLAFSVSSFCLAQYPGGIAIDALFAGEATLMLDSADFRFTYSLRCVVDTTRPDDPLIQKLSLVVGKKYSFFHNGELRSRPITKGSWPLVNSEGLGGTFVYKDYQSRKAEVITQVPGDDYLWTYEEALPAQQWTVCEEFRIIKDYSCQKATTSYMGRDYTAWFTLGIPIPEGPWKFYGLPGMILEVSDSQGHYVFTCVEIISLDKKESICRYDWKLQKARRTDIWKTMKRVHKDLTEYNRSLHPNIPYIVVGRPEHSELPYNPIELE